MNDIGLLLGSPNVVTTALGSMARATAVILLGFNTMESATASTYPRETHPDHTQASPTNQLNNRPNVRIETATAAILEIRRLSGLTWDELSELFAVTRRSVHHWASGKPVNATHDMFIRRTLAIIRKVDRGESDRTRSILLTSIGDGRSIYEYLKAGDFDSALEAVKELPDFVRSKLTPLSNDERQKRRPPAPIRLLDARLDQLDQHNDAIANRFVPLPRK